MKISAHNFMAAAANDTLSSSHMPAGSRTDLLLSFPLIVQPLTHINERSLSRVLNFGAKLCNWREGERD
jgi:hypothetical protein